MTKRTMILVTLDRHAGRIGRMLPPGALPAG
jgi:hypothetical protein